MITSPWILKSATANPCIAGTRVLVTTVLDNLASGPDSEEITKSCPSVSREAVRAAISYAAALANERVVSLQE